jgi:microcystin-dependent protein
MADLVVKPAYVMGPTDILTVDKFNLMATPIVELSIADRIDDQNFFRNGNFYSSFWTTPAGMDCPPGVETTNADYWTVNPTAGDVTALRSIVVPDLYSLFSMEIQGTANVTDCRVSQVINGDLSATLRRVVTFSGYIYSGAGLSVSPKLEIWTADAFNGGTYTLQQTEDLQTCANGLWTYCSVGFDLTNVTNITNGLRLAILIPSGALSGTAKFVLFSRLKVQIGELATEFTDDVGLFVQTPSVDSTMLQDGCIARPALFLPNVIPQGAYMAGSIRGVDIGTGEIKGSNLDPGIATTTSALFSVPAAQANVGITMTSVTGISAGLVLTIQGAGSYSVVSVAGSVVTAQNTGAAGNAAPGTVIASGAIVTTSGNAVIGGLGYTPINKAGDSAIGPGPLAFSNEVVIGSTAFQSAAALVQGTAANASNDGYMPAIGFHRPGVRARAVGLDINGKFKTVDQAGTVGYLLDTVTKVNGGTDIQDASITYQKLAQSLINLLVPIGAVLPFAGVSPPGGWFVCDGSAVSRTTYAALFAQLGTYWGTGDNVSTFNIPNLVNRVPVGYGTGTIYGYGTYGGEVNHTLSGAEMPNHSHSITDQLHGHSDSGHTHQRAAVFVGAGSTIASGNGWGLGTAAGGTGYAAISNAYSNINHTEAVGGNATHNNMQPYAVLYFIIKAV